jgi:outer membrane protein
MHSRRCRYILAALLALVPLGRAFADDDCQEPSGDCVAVGGWNFSLSLGAGVRTNPVVHESEIPLVVIPQFSYYGKHFFIDNLDAGVTLLDDERSTLSLVASPGYDRVFFYHSDPQNIFVTGLTAGGGIGTSMAPGATPTLVTKNNADGTTIQVPAVKIPPRSRQITYLAGPEWTFKYAGLTGQVDLLHEITGHDHGSEVRAAVGIPLGHLGGSWSTNFGFTWKSANVVNYYYGEPGIYEGGAAFDPFVKLAFSRPLKGKWKLTAFVETERLGNAIADSPLVDQRYVTTTFVGAMYAF